MYEAPEIVELGPARELILGVKPIMPSVDSDFEPNHANEIDDIDEVDG